MHLQPVNNADGITTSVEDNNLTAPGHNPNEAEVPDLTNATADASKEEITNNDGSIIETLDTALHGQPGYIDGHSLAGSNRADYYEARTDGKSDVQEESDYLKKMQENK